MFQLKPLKLRGGKCRFQGPEICLERSRAELGEDLKVDRISTLASVIAENTVWNDDFRLAYNFALIVY